jgi:hypothetical protein
MHKPRVIAFYLPQFHPIPENDEWWGRGFTEWTNVGKAKRFFLGHYQPRVPADLGYYDLRIPETREAQAELARKAGIEGFCYWHYWFGNGKQLLERPFSEVLASGKPDFPFCLAWANEDWKGFSHGLTNRNTLMAQLYPGISDYIEHFYSVLPAFKDKRYIRINDKPLFLIYKPLASIEISLFIKTWRQLAKENGLLGIYFIGHYISDITNMKNYENLDLDAINIMRLNDYINHKKWIFRKVFSVCSRLRWLVKKPHIVKYKTAAKFFFNDEIDTQENIIPTIISGWDHTPRSGYHGKVMTHYTPKLFYDHVFHVINNTNKNPNVVFLKSWNEWAEGNYIEPDLKWGNQFLEVLASVIKSDEC